MKYVFVCGVPGSCWGWPINYLYEACDLVDTTSSKPWRINNNQPCAAIHKDTLFAGPYHEIGEMFDQLRLFPNKQAIFSEIDSAFDHTIEHKIRVVQCHWFSYQLDWIVENLPEVDILLGMRNPEMSFNHWHNGGGWKIEHPSYKWYNNSQTLWRQSQIEHKLMQQFVKQHDLRIINGWGADWVEWHWPELAPYVDKLKFPGGVSSAVGHNGANPIHVGWDSLSWAFYKGKNSSPIHL